MTEAGAGEWPRGLPAPTARGRALAIAGGWLLSGAGGWNVANVGPIASETAHAYGVGLATVGLFTTALFIPHTLSQLPGGRACDAHGARRVGLVGIAALLTGGALAMLAANVALVLAARAVTGLGSGLSFIAGVAYLREVGASPLMQGAFGGVGIAAGGAALVSVPLLEPALGWRAPYWTSLAFATLALAVLLAAPPGRVRTAAAASVVPMRRFAGDARLRRLAVLYSASFGLAVVLGNWAVELLERTSDLDRELIAVTGGLVLLGGAISRTAGGWLLRSRPARVRPALAVSLALAAAGTVALAAGRPPVAVVAGSAVLGLGAGLAFAPAMSAAAAAFPHAPGGAMAFVNTFALALIVVGTPLLGLTFSLPGDGRIGFAVAAALWLVALALLPGRKTFTAAGG